ncbi:hypothetical protein BVY01_01425 [bacterium I07]|nr:hypothetical protein BVY01_01425 [bacterium I07]
MINKVISHFKILEKLGEGGMGVVYKAHDTKLDRIVALKFLPSHITANETDKARFLQEAKAAAAISHANVCVIHEIQEHEGQQMIVMEYVEGVTLSEKIKSNPLELKTVIDYAMQIGEGLKAAHAKGIVHRDIKSSNIMVTDTNQIKVMDFGLAKLRGSTKLTKTTSTIGTLAYMSPEHLQNKEIDARTDIFSFGVVLYEMLTGELPFRGDYDSALMYSIVNDDPEPVGKFRSDVSSEIMHIMNKVLEKDPEDRYQSVKEMVIDLKRVKRDSDRVVKKIVVPSSSEISEVVKLPEVSKIRNRKKRKPLFIILAALVLIILSLTILRSLLRQSDSSVNIQRFTSYVGREYDSAFSPYGNHLAFSWGSEDGQNWDIYVKQVGVEQFDAHRVTNHPFADFWPTWSPDDKYIAFHRVEFPGTFEITDFGEIFQVPFLGGQEKRLTTGFHPNWSPDGKIIIFCDWDSTEIRTLCLFSFNFETGERKKLIQPPVGYRDFAPKISPDSKKVAFLRSASLTYGASPKEIYIMTMKDLEPTPLTNDNAGIMGLTWSHDSRYIIFGSNRSSLPSLWKIDVKGGTLKQVPVMGNRLVDPAISSDGKRLACSQSLPITSLWRYDISNLKDSNPILEKFITSGSRRDEYARYSHDGRKITYVSYASGRREIWVCDQNGKNRMKLTDFAPAWQSQPRWSPDGKIIVFHSTKYGNRDIFSIPSNGGITERLTTDISDEQNPSWSYDNQHIYFESIRGGEWNIYKMNLKSGEVIQLTRNGGTAPVESPDGKWLYYSKDWDSHKPSIYRITTDGGEENLVYQYRYLEHPLYENYGKADWQPFDNGIYFQEIDMDSKAVIKFLEFKNNRVSTITKIQGIGQTYHISPDRQFLLYSNAEFDSDIILVENWE